MHVRTLRVGHVQHVAVLLEHVDLFNAGHGLHGQLLQRALELRVLAASDGTLGLLHNLAAGSTLATSAGSSLQLRELLLIKDHAG